MDKHLSKNIEIFFLTVGLLAVGFFGGMAYGFKHGAQYTYDSIYLLFTNSIGQAAYELDCKMTNSSITIEKRSMPLPDTFQKCCYPKNCPQAINNPKVCVCEYTILCMSDINISTKEISISNCTNSTLYNWTVINWTEMTVNISNDPI